jgi:hypothetical protein
LKETTRSIPSWCRSALMASCLLALAGCGSGHSPGEANDQDDEHVGHVIPAHKPKSFPDAVHRLHEINDSIRRDVVAARPGAPPDTKAVNIALDIANWLPEIAGDSDMPEAPWNAVSARSAALLADYQKILSGASQDARAVVDDARLEIGKLEQLLAESDTRWFGETGKRASAP